MPLLTRGSRRCFALINGSQRSVALVNTSLLAFALVALAALLPVPGRTQSRSPFVHHRVLHVAAALGRPAQRVLVSWPRRAGAAEVPTDARWPVLVALHGAHEATLAVDRACVAWSVDYRLDAAIGALMRGRVSRADYGGLVSDARLSAVNAQLRARPFRGLFVVTPYTPNLLASGSGSDAMRGYGDWLAGPVLAAVRAEFPAARERSGVGIDGVSLGGRLALEVGLSHPETFGVVGALQPAIDPPAIEALVRAAQARPAAHSQPLRVVTSDGDGGLAAARAFSSALREARVPHDLLVASGRHGYEFNRGPGALEMTLFHDAALAAETAPRTPRR